ncbi:MAG: bacteriohemerythrin [Steroidobacteraceae bacterium]
MTLLQWRDDFRIGIEEVDHEHQELIGLINSLHAALGEDRSAERVEGFLGEIYASISGHFALEEKVMRARRYDGLAAHKADHERLLDDLRDLMDEQAGGAPLDEEQFATRLAQWFSGHFQTHDARLHRFLGA